MPLLAAAIGTFFTSLGSFLASMFIARIGLRVTGVLAITLAGGALMLAFNEFVKPLVQMLFNTEYGQLLGLIFPPISGTVVTGLMGLWLAIQTYKLQVKAIKATTGL